MFEQDHLEQVEEDDLLRVVLVVDGGSQVRAEWLDDHVHDLHAVVGADLAHGANHELHKLTGRRIHDLGFLVQLPADTLHEVSHDELQSQVDNHSNVLAARFQGVPMLLLGSLLIVVRHRVELLADDLIDLHAFLNLVEIFLNVIRDVSEQNVLHELLLRRQDDVL